MRADFPSSRPINHPEHFSVFDHSSLAGGSLSAGLEVGGGVPRGLCVRSARWGWQAHVKVQGPGCAPNCLDVLVYQNRVSIWIRNHKASRASSAFVCFGNHIYATIFELALQLSNVREFFEWLGIAPPARVEGENVLIEHALKQPNIMVAILHNQPILRLISCENCKTQLLVKSFDAWMSFTARLTEKFPSSMISSQVSVPDA